MSDWSVAAAGIAHCLDRGFREKMRPGRWRGHVMATLDLAKFMAGAALKNSMTAHGWTAHGPVRMKCDTSSIGLPHCLARQKACG